MQSAKSRTEEILSTEQATVFLRKKKRNREKEERKAEIHQPNAVCGMYLDPDSKKSVV